MLEAVRGWVLGLLRVPPDPSPPEGGRVIRVFRAAPSYLRLRLLVWVGRQAGALAALVGGLLVARAALRAVDEPTVAFLITAGEGLAWAAFLAQIPFSLAVLWLDYDLRWYILSDRSLRIREGVVSVREKTVTFANIQQISIRQNPLQRLLGIADVQVSTAGGGSGGAGGHGHVGESMHEAYFRGVDNAEEIRTAIRERVRLHRDSGLGDPDEPAPVAPRERVAAPVVTAARELRDEVRALRGALAG